jgi:hypothetical protein
MSSKFGLTDDAEEIVERQDGKIDLSGFAPVQKRPPIDFAEVDAAAAPHGFVSREATPLITGVANKQGRRRATTPEARRHLAVRMVKSQYDRFVGYADRYKLTYHDAIAKLLDAAGE